MRYFSLSIIALCMAGTGTRCCPILANPSHGEAAMQDFVVEGEKGDGL